VPSILISAFGCHVNTHPLYHKRLKISALLHETQAPLVRQMARQLVGISAIMQIHSEHSTVSLPFIRSASTDAAYRKIGD